MMLDDLRTISMLDWLENDLLLTIISCEPASSDASFRRYFRIKVPDGQFIIMDAPPEKENIEPFIRVAKLLKRSNVNVPNILQQNLTDGFLLLEDFGSQCFLDRLNAGNASTLYQSALDALFKLQSYTTIQDCSLPSYNEPLLQRELGIFEDWFLNELLDIQIPASLWKSVCTILVNSALEQPIICVHRDYHSRNLMVLHDDSLGVIDFQDAVIGPITYDLVSLLRDCYIAWPNQQVELWMNDYYERLLHAELIACTPVCFKRWFDLMGVQRHLKAIGIFSRLHLRDGKSSYLNDIPRTLNYVMTICANYPEFEGFSEFLQKQVLPAYTILSSFPKEDDKSEVIITR
ncbi:MAG: phosphotransferase [Methylococcaceae bacterium]|nr:phosphotransferase [Methylococcaceae bacterium]